MVKTTRCLVLSITLGLTSAAVRADAIVNSSLSLVQMQIIPAQGSLLILSGVTASTFAQALDSLGGLDQQFSSVTDAATSISASTALGNASASASATALTGSVTANIDFPNAGAFASTEGQSVLSGTFEITGTTGSVSVDFTAFLSLSLLLQTTGLGESAVSEASFTLTLPDIGPNPVLSFDNLPSIGSDQTLNQTLSPTLTQSLMVPADTPESFTIALDTDPTASSTTPEPPSLLLAALGMSCLAGFRARRRARARVPASE